MPLTNRKKYNRTTGPKPVIRSVGLAIIGLAVTGFFLWAAKRTAGGAHRKVSLYLTVETQDHSKLIRGLPAKDFRLYEDGHARQFKLEKPKKPARVALLVEYSESSWPYFGDIVRSMRSFVNNAPKGNWYALATFSNKMKVRQDFTKQRGRVAQAFSSLGQPMWREINTYDAVYNMLDRMSHLSGRRIIILIGSGFDSMSSHTLDNVLHKVQSTNVVIYSIGTGSLFRGAYNAYLSSMQRMTLLQAQNFMRSLSKKSGGQAWFPRFQRAFNGVMQGAMEDIESQYKMVYKPEVPANGQLYKIKVDAFRIVNDQRKNYYVRVREGWRFGSSG